MRWAVWISFASSWQTYEVLASQNNGQPTIAVPTHFAKVIIASRSPSSASSSPSRASHPSPKASAPASPSSALTSLAVYDSNQAAAAKEWSIGAFVLPNAVIPEQTRLETFLVPGELVRTHSCIIFFDSWLLLTWCSYISGPFLYYYSLAFFPRCSTSLSDTIHTYLTVESIESSAGLTLLPDQLKKIARPLCSTVSCQLVIRKFDDASKGKGSNGKAGGNGGGGARSNSWAMWEIDWSQHSLLLVSFCIIAIVICISHSCYPHLHHRSAFRYM